MKKKMVLQKNSREMEELGLQGQASSSHVVAFLPSPTLEDYTVFILLREIGSFYTNTEKLIVTRSEEMGTRVKNKQLSVLFEIFITSMLLQQVKYNTH